VSRDALQEGVRREGWWREAPGHNPLHRIRSIETGPTLRSRVSMEDWKPVCKADV